MKLFVELTMRHHTGLIIKLLNCLIITFLLFSCKTTNKLKEGEYLLDENIITNNKTEVSTDEIAPFIRQQSNRHLVSINALGIKWFPYYLWMYNSIDKTKMQNAKIARDKKYDEINAQRIIKNNIKNKKREVKGKKPKPLKLKDKTSLTWRETWVQNGEPPVILDSGLIKLGKEQIKKFLFTKGYFNAIVNDSVVVSRNKKKANVYYKLQAGIPYQINNTQYKIEDPTLEYFILQDTVHSLIKRGMRYDVDVLTKERERISKQQRNDGYYKFGPEFIYLLVDTNIEGNNVNLEINVKKYAYHPENNTDTLLYANHLRYHINNIYIITDYDIFNRSKQYNDTAVYDDVTFLYTKKLLFRKKDIANKISFYKEELFNNDKVEETYARLSSMKAFKSVNINFKQDEHKQDYINSYILMSPTYKQNFGIETDGTNTSGNLGVEASITYQNKNIFKGSELLEIKLKGGLIAQKNFEADNTNNNLNGAFLKGFNTVQFGPELNLNFPKPLFPFTLIKYAKNAAPKTILSTSFNFQQNSLYSRGLTSLSYGVQFNGKKYIKHSIVPFEANLIKAYLSQGFSDQLRNSGNLFLSTSFKSHMTTVSRYTFIYNNQLNTQASQYKTFSYFKADLESSGNLLRGAYNLTDQHKNSLGQYEILNVPFAQFLRADIDYRVYKSVRKLGRFVYRISGGMGYALQNLTALPYEKSFYGGGPNDVRAWQTRSLGPGGYNIQKWNAAQTDPKKKDVYNDKIGDIQIEMNFEYRFNIYKWLNAAYFIDAGNVWLRQKQEIKPLGDFQFNRFYREFAVGTGIGIRADFSFFILRIDGAYKTFDPSYDQGNRFVFGKHKFGDMFVLNFGIGYPF